MNTTYTCRQPYLRENYPNDIIERDEQGNIVGAWYGYYHPGTYTVKLYPNRRHPFVKWQRTPKVTLIDARLVKCVGSAKGEEIKPVKSQTAKAMRDIIGQIKIKF